MPDFNELTMTQGSGEGNLKQTTSRGEVVSLENTFENLADRKIGKRLAWRPKCRSN